MKKQYSTSAALLIFFICAIVLAAQFKGSKKNPESISVVQGPVGDFVFAVSWQPAFCETRPNRPECRSQYENRYDASHFSLHGLWPQPANNHYCGVEKRLIALDKSGEWRKLPKLDLSNELRSELSIKMPGYRSFLHRHEWYKHGACIPGITPEIYFQVSLGFLDTLNQSKLARFFGQNPGLEVSFLEVARLADRSFGRGAGERIEMDCYRTSGRRLIGQLEFSLKGEIHKDTDFAALLLSGETEERSCPSGIIDRVGIQ